MDIPAGIHERSLIQEELGRCSFSHEDFPWKLDVISLNHKAEKQELHPKAFSSAHQGTEQLNL